jgi:hypothetical protein
MLEPGVPRVEGGGRRHQRPLEALEADQNLRLPKELLILNRLQLH